MESCVTVGKRVTVYDTTRSRLGFKGVDWCSPEFLSGKCPTTEISQTVCTSGSDIAVTDAALGLAVAQWKAITKVRSADFLLPYRWYTYTYPVWQDDQLGAPTIDL